MTKARSWNEIFVLFFVVFVYCVPLKGVYGIRDGVVVYTFRNTTEIFCNPPVSLVHETKKSFSLLGKFLCTFSFLGRPREILSFFHFSFLGHPFSVFLSLFFFVFFNP